MKQIACYGIYRGMNSGLAKFLRKQAALNGSLPIAIDTMFYRPTSRSLLSIRGVISFIVENLRHLKWYILESAKGHLIFPAPLVAAVITILNWKHLSRIYFMPAKTAVGLYHLEWPDSFLHEEFMATYLRYVAQPSEQYGLSPYDERLALLAFFSHSYRACISKLFSLIRPISYFSFYSSYLHNFIPCSESVSLGVPVVVIGCTDCLYRIDDKKVPRQFEHFSLDDVPSDFHPSITAKGNIVLNSRLKGSIDLAINYMEKSPYSTHDVSSFWGIEGVSLSMYEYETFNRSGASKNGNLIVVFMHEFQDWHHNGVLPVFASSYYEWLLITVSFLLKNKLNFLVKVHPAITGEPLKYRQTVEALSGLSSVLGSKLPVSTTATTLELLELGMAIGVTVRGTIALELAHLGCRFMCAGTPPYAALFPLRIVSDKASYFDRLLRYDLEPPISTREAAAAAFYAASQQDSLQKPQVNVNGSMLKLSPDYEFIHAKTLAK